MSNSINYELGFDWDQANNPPQLSWGRVMNGAPDDFNVSLQKGDLVCFDLVNLTDNATLADYSIVGGTVTFAAWDTKQSTASPFFLPALQIASFRATAQRTPCPSFKKRALYPSWTPIIPLTPTDNDGDFKFSVSLTIQGPNGVTKTFVVDPEMVVGSIG